MITVQNSVSSMPRARNAVTRQVGDMQSASDPRNSFVRRIDFSRGLVEASFIECSAHDAAPQTVVVPVAARRLSLDFDFADPIHEAAAGRHAGDDHRLQIVRHQGQLPPCVSDRDE